MLAVTVTLPGFLRFARPSLSIASTSSLLDRKSACAQHRRGCVYRCRLSSAITELRACALDGESTLHGSLAFKIKRSRVPARCGFKNSEDLEFFVRLDMRPGSDAAPLLRRWTTVNEILNFINWDQISHKFMICTTEHVTESATF